MPGKTPARILEDIEARRLKLRNADLSQALLFLRYLSDRGAAPPGCGFADLAGLRGRPDIGAQVDRIVARIAAANDLTGVIDVVRFDDPGRLGRGQELVDRLSNLLTIFADPALDLGRNQAGGDDLLGDAHEYLLRHFASEAGKSKGQFYTPAEVSRIMAKVVGLDRARAGQTIHDPTCGSGSLLLKAYDEARRAGQDLALCGQEVDPTTAALARMNLMIHGCSKGQVRDGNTLSSPQFTTASGALQTFDYVVANPPFSMRAWANGLDPERDVHGRFVHGVPPRKNGDYAFLLHVLACLAPTGKAAVIVPHGVLFRGHAEAEIRRRIVDMKILRGIIGLPADLFFGTAIPACILVIDREHADTRTGMFIIDASRDSFIKDGTKNRLRDQDILRITDVFTRRLEVPRFSREVSYGEIADPRNAYSLSLPRYLDTAEPEELHDIDAHLHGGIPDRDLDALAPHWQAFPGLRADLFAPARPGYSELRVAPEAVRPTILAHPEFAVFKDWVTGRFAGWQDRSRARLRALAPGDRPAALIEALGHDIIKTFAGAPLVDAYVIYQRLMDRWAATIEDDVILVVAEGWRVATRPPAGAPGKKGRGAPRPGMIGPDAIVARYFAAEQAALDAMHAAATAATQAVQELLEEHEDGALEGRPSRAAVTKIIEEADADERPILSAYLAALSHESSTRVAVKTCEEALSARVAQKYEALTDDDIKNLVVEDRWLAALSVAVDEELERVSRAFARRIDELAARYAAPLGALDAEVAALAARVQGHLKGLRT